MSASTNRLPLSPLTDLTLRERLEEADCAVGSAVRHRLDKYADFPAKLDLAREYAAALKARWSA